VSDEPNKVADETPPEAEAAALVEGQAPAVEAAAPETDAPEAVDEAVTEAVEAEEVEAVEDDASVEEVEVDGEVEEEEEESVDESDEVAEDEASEEATADEATEEVDGDDDSDEIKMDWYILKVQSNREKSITDALRRKIAVEGLEDYFGDVVVPVEKVTEFKNGKKRVVQRKLYPGYIVVHMCINDDTWFAVRETSGIGDFTGSGGKPTPMLAHEIARIVQQDEEETEETPKLNISFAVGDSVKVKEGNFESFEGDVHTIDEHSGRVTVMINIFGRSTPVELEYWQVEQI